jgi:hypothetical protein
MSDPNSKLIQLNNCDIEDIEDVLKEVESSFGFRFAKNDVAEVRTFGQVCDVIFTKLPSSDVADCTTQQAFYKLRTAIAEVSFVEKAQILPVTRLEVFFPRKNRRGAIKRLESRIGFRLQMLRPKGAVSNALMICSLMSVVEIFIHWKLAIVGFVVAFTGFKLAWYFGKEWEVWTVGELATSIMKTNYRRSRRDPNTINKAEINNRLINIFSENLGLDPIVFTKDASFF